MTFVPRTSNPPPSVLVVNGSPDICSVFADCLATKGYETESVLYGASCVERLQRHAFSAVILHDRLPDQDGLSLLTAIRTIHATLPVIVTTVAGPSPGALQQGAYAVFVLPYRCDELYDTLQRVEEKGSGVFFSRRTASGTISRRVAGISFV
jgi:two-component system response regulator HydG